MDEKIRKALAAAQADYVEVRLQRTRLTTIRYQGRELEDIGERRGVGGCVRALVRGGWGFASFNDLENLADYVRRACGQARLIGGGTETLALTAPQTDRRATTPLEAPASVSLAEKQELCERYNNRLLTGSERIQTTTTVYADRQEEVTFANTEGAHVVQETDFAGIYLSALAMDGANVQQAYHSVGDLRGFQIVRGLDAKCDEVVRRAVDMLAARGVKGGRYTVIMDPVLAGVFVHEAFGHLSEADFVYENLSMREIMTLGRRFGNEKVTIIDDPSLPQEAGSYAYDDEGTPARPTTLLREGVLAGRLHSRETAARMGEEPTGNARALDHTFAPIVRMSNTYLKPGDSRIEDMLARTDKGIYARGFLGGETNMEMFTFAAEEAFEIKRGKLGRKLRDVTLTGNVFETLEHIRMVGDDLAFYGGLGGCGKGGQNPLRVSNGGPHVLAEDVLVGGHA